MSEENNGNVIVQTKQEQDEIDEEQEIECIEDVDNEIECDNEDEDEDEDDETENVELVQGVPMEDLIKGEPATVEEVKMIECPVCNLNVISFMMEEHKENCAGADVMYDDMSRDQSYIMDEEIHEIESQELEDVEDVEGDEEQVKIIDANPTNQCPHCHKVYLKKFHLDRHLKHSDCTGIKIKYECKVCGKTYSRPDNLRAHLRSMHVDVNVKDKSVECPECKRVLKNKAVLTVHMRIHTGERPFECDFCPKRFPTSGAYQKHKRTHTGERPFECTQCGKTFTAKEVLNRHIQTHVKVKPHVCMFCSKSFVQAMQLRAHMFHHTGEPTYHCQHCNASYQKQSSLSIHVKYEHEGAQPFECEVCHKKFLTKNLLVRHQIIHSGRKDFECQTCHKRFVSKPSLKTHMLTHRREEPRICYDCGRAFIRLDCLIRHMRAKHRDVLQDMIQSTETKKIKQHVLSAQCQVQMEKGTNWSDDTYMDNLRKLLLILIDETTLFNFGWPDRPIDKILDSLIIRCGSTPNTDDSMDYIDRLRENTKILFTGIINDAALETLLNNNTVDEVVNFVLKLSGEATSADETKTTIS